MSRRPGQAGSSDRDAAIQSRDESLGGSHCQPHRLITGFPGVGKTTLIRDLARRLADSRPVGFYTEEIRNAHGTREGFRLVTFGGRQLVFSHVRDPGPARVSRYGVDVAGFEQVLAELDLGHTQSRLIIIDEIGKMECLSRRFIQEVTRLLNGPAILVASIALKGEGFVQAVKQRPDCRLVTITKENRDRLPGEIAEELRQELRGGPLTLGLSSDDRC